MTDVGLIQFGARFLDFAPVLSDESTRAPLEMTRIEILLSFDYAPFDRLRAGRAKV